MFLTSGMLLTMAHLQSQPEASLSVVNYLYLVSWLGKPPLIVLSMQRATHVKCVSVIMCFLCAFCCPFLYQQNFHSGLIIEQLGGGGGALGSLCDCVLLGALVHCTHYCEEMCLGCFLYMYITNRLCVKILLKNENSSHISS